MGAEEFHGSGAEKGPENKELSQEQLEKRHEIGEALEASAEKSKIENGEQLEAKARVEALEKAVSVEAGSAEKKGKESSRAPAQRRHGVVSKRDRKASYTKHMKQLQSELSPTQRAFSKVIHNPVAECYFGRCGCRLLRRTRCLRHGSLLWLPTLWL